MNLSHLSSRRNIFCSINYNTGKKENFSNQSIIEAFKLSDIKK